MPAVLIVALVLAGWTAASVVVGLVFGRSVRNADEREKVGADW